MAEEKNAPKNRVFISYSRKDKAFVQRLHQSLLAYEVQTWVDWEGIPLTADWMAEIKAAIQSADAFLFIISPDSLKSKYCLEELALCLENNKKLVPILHREPETDDAMPDKVGAHNWVYLRQQDDYDGTIPKLIEALQTDLEWVRQHTRLLTRAVEWENKTRNSSFLLQGSDLQEAEAWQTQAAASENRVITPLQSEYIAVSRQQADRRQRIFTASVSVALVITLFLAVFAFIQRGRAVSNERAALTAQAQARDNEQRAQDNAATAVANEQARSTQQVLAEQNARLAEQNAGLAEQKEQARATQQAVAEQNAELARQQQIEAEAGRIAAQGRLIALQPANIQVSTLLGLQSLSISWNFAASDLVRTNLSLTPLPLAQKAHFGVINQLALSPDGSVIATCSDDRTARIWDFATGKELQRFEHDTMVKVMAFSPDGKSLATGSADGSLRLWNIGSGEFTQVELSAGVTALAISPDGINLAIGLENGRGMILEFPTLRQFSAIGHASGFTYLTYRPDGKQFASASQAGETMVWTRKANRLSAPQHTAEVFKIIFSPNGKWVATAGADHLAQIGEVSTGLTAYYLRHEDWVNDLVFSPDSSRLVTVSDDSSVHVWEVTAGREILRMRHQDGVSFVDYSPDGKWIATSSSDGSARIWDAITGNEIARIPLFGPGGPLRFSLDSKKLVVTNRAGGISIWDISPLTGKTAHLVLPESTRGIDVNGDRLITGGDSGWALLWSVADLLAGNNQPVAQKLVLANRKITTVKLGNKQSAAIAGENGEIIVLPPGGQRVVLQHQAAVSAIAFLQDDTRLLSAAQDQTIIQWDLASASALATLRHPAPVNTMAVSPDEKWVYAGFEDQVWTWDITTLLTTTLLQQSRIPGGASVIQHLEISGDGQWLAGSTNAYTALLWKLDMPGALQTLQPRTTLAHNSPILSMVFSAGNQRIYTGTVLGNLHIWDVNSGRESGRISFGLPISGLELAGDGSQLMISLGRSIVIWDMKSLPLIADENLIQETCKYLLNNLSLLEWNTYFPGEEYQVVCPGLPSPISNDRR